MSTTTNTVNISQITVSAPDTSKTGWGAVLADQPYFAIATGTADDESFDAADVGNATGARMAAHGRGVTANLGAGNDTVVGSAWGDSLSGGAGVNRVDGGANGGTDPSGAAAVDILDVFVDSPEAAASVQVVSLEGRTFSGEDVAAWSAGYRYKVMNSFSETTYIKNVERVNVWTGKERAFARSIELTVLVQEATPASFDFGQLAWVHGGPGNDTVVAAAGSGLFSSALETQMHSAAKGVWIDGGAGLDLIVGTGFNDVFRDSAGGSKIDGGAHLGAAGHAGGDVFEINALGSYTFDTIAAALSDDPAYTWMVQYHGDTNYLRNIEQIAVFDPDSGRARTIPLVTIIAEQPAEAARAGAAYLAHVTGTALAETFSIDELGAGTRALMAQFGRGVHVNMGSGNDTITGSLWADYLEAGNGTDFVDGGANEPGAYDVLHVTAASPSDVRMSALSATGTDADVSAFGKGYTHKVVHAWDNTTYVKNIAWVTVHRPGPMGSGYDHQVQLGVIAQEAVPTAPGTSLLNQVAWVRGSGNGDVIDAASLLSPALRAQMASARQGVWIDGGDGHDTVTGSAYADVIRNGFGNALVDGGAHASAGGRYGGDVFEIDATANYQPNGIQIAVSDRIDYEWMITYGTDTSQRDYLRNMEGVVILNSPGNGPNQFVALAVSVDTVDAAHVAGAQYLATIIGTEGADNLTTAYVPAATRALMDQYQRGVKVTAKAGSDTVVGSAYVDQIDAGAGINYVDGGADLGTSYDGARTLPVRSHDTARFQSTALAGSSLLSASGSSDDVAAFKNGYTHKITSTDGQRIDYLKNIEAVEVYRDPGDAERGAFMQRLYLSIVTEERDAGDPLMFIHYGIAAMVHGTGGTEHIDASGASPLLSATAHANMAASKVGVEIAGGGGDDVITGTGYIDYFVNGAGNGRIDGGAHESTLPISYGDVFKIDVRSRAEQDTIAVLPSDDPAYQFMVTYGDGKTQRDYLRDVEEVRIKAEWEIGVQDRVIPLAMTVRANPQGSTATQYAGSVRGSITDDVFSVDAHIAPALRASMDVHQRGLSITMDEGNDTVTASPYGDTIDGGRGINFIDGGAQQGTGLYGMPAADMVYIHVPRSTTDYPHQVVQLAKGAGSAADDAALSKGYTHKVSNASANWVNYLKDIEAVEIWGEGVGEVIRVDLPAKFSLVAPQAVTPFMLDAWQVANDFAVHDSADAQPLPFDLAGHASLDMTPVPITLIGT